MSRISRVEFDLESTILRMDRADLTADEVHDRLLSIAELLGEVPQAVQGGRGVQFVWHVNDRLIIVSLDSLRSSPANYWMTVDSLEWEAWKWWDRHQNGYEDVSGPYHLWTLPIANPRLKEGGYEVTTWGELFAVFSRLNDLPRELELIPPQWRSTWWSPCPGGFNIYVTGAEQTTASVAYWPGRVELAIGEDDPLVIPTDSLGRAPWWVDIAAVLAEQTATGSLDELYFLNEEFSFTRFPRGPQGVAPTGPSADFDAPPRLQTLTDVQRILTRTFDPLPPQPEPEHEDGTTPTPVMTPQDTVDMCFELSQPTDPMAVLEARGVQWQTATTTGSIAVTRIGQLDGCQVRVHISTLRGRTARSIRVDLVPGEIQQHAAYAFARQMNQLMGARAGEPQSYTASSKGYSIRRWRLDDKAIALGVSGFPGLAVTVEPWDDMVRYFFTG